MEGNFTNDTIDISLLPRFEDTKLTSIEPDYWKVIVFNTLFTYIIFIAASAAVVYFIEELHPYILYIVLFYLLLITVTLIIYRISFKNKGYAFRTHDVIYKAGAIAVTTHIIPYNRVQHAALHEGFVSRRFGLASIEVFTAGGVNGDIRIRGIKKEEAETMKQLLMGKVTNPVVNE